MPEAMTVSVEMFTTAGIRRLDRSRKLDGVAFMSTPAAGFDRLPWAAARPLTGEARRMSARAAA